MDMIISQLTCQRCSYEWFPRGDPPKVCPRCKSYKWQVNKQ